MHFPEITLPDERLAFLQKNEGRFRHWERANAWLEAICGIRNFFESPDQLAGFLRFISEKGSNVQEPDRRAYGDFQTNEPLARKAVQYLLSGQKGRKIDFLLEPTCGRGNFILAALAQTETLKKITGIEIYAPYVWEAKFRVLDFFIRNPNRPRPEMEIIHANVFDFDFERLARETQAFSVLLTGNPPWVTHAALGAIEADNLPQKSNFKRHRGLDAITGKSNFDLGEPVLLRLLRHFSTHRGCMGFLVKNAVAKNLLHDQKQNAFPIGALEKLNIDAKKEFNASVDACLFVARLNETPALSCTERDFYTGEKRTSFGWVNERFVYSISAYREAKDIEGKSPFIWRQGIKHDCAKVMELEKEKGHFRNGFEEKVKIEKDLVYGLMKSADLKGSPTNAYRKSTIVTQKKIGQSTGFIQTDYPLTFAYLWENKAHFDRRKSAIYKGKPDFSIFGVGDYSFMPFKVAVSGLYKSTHFTLVLPEKDKPLMLDDTCYFIGFDRLSQAKIACFLLNHAYTRQFLKAIVFPDAKRSITKEALMRIDLGKVYDFFDFDWIQNECDTVSWEEWKAFGEMTRSCVDSN